MQHIKRFLSFALVLVMMLSCIPGQALAVENNEDTYVATIAATGEFYTSLELALEDCFTGETVTLLKDTSVTTVTVLENTTLDLNGHTLDAYYATCYGNLIDSSDANTGLLNVAESRFLIREDNKQLPLKDGDGYRFFEVTKINTAMINATKFAFQPLFEGAALELLKKGGNETGLTVEVQVGWKQTEGYRSQQFVYNDDLLTQFLDSYNPATGKYSKMFTLTLNNTRVLKI